MKNLASEIFLANFFQCSNIPSVFEIISISHPSENGSLDKNLFEHANADTTVLRSKKKSTPSVGLKSSPNAVDITRNLGFVIPNSGPMSKSFIIIPPFMIKYYRTSCPNKKSVNDIGPTRFILFLSSNIGYNR